MIKDKYEKLLAEIKSYGKLAVAFSGGVDSTLLLKAAYDALGKNALAVTVKSDFMPKSEIEEAKNIANDIGVEQVMMNIDVLEYTNIAKNPFDRCYHCKAAIFTKIMEEMEKRGFDKIAEGSNLDDINDYRPGFKAVEELGVVSPLLDVEITKEEIRELAKELNLPNWNKPTAACLASRIPYGDEITKEALERVCQAELILSSYGFINARVRLHKTVARIEIMEKDFENFLKNRERILYSLKSLDFPYIALDLEGYKRGSLNKVK